MIDFNLLKYIDYVKSKTDKTIEDYYIEKDYLLSLFLSTWQTLRNKKRIRELDELIFKGGTLLMRNHLDYPRISEDLDFTHKKCEDIRNMSQNNRIKTIRKLIKPILEEIKIICNTCGFDFQTDRSNTRYVTAYNHKAVYSLSIYYISEITNNPIRLKIEINFVEQLQYQPSIQNIKPLISKDSVLASIGYNLVPLKLYCYKLKEMVLEKYRAVLTRDNPMERDIYDLYLINNKKLDIFSIDIKKILRKIDSGRLATSHLKKNLRANCNALLRKGSLESDEEIQLLTLSNVDENEYKRFRKKLFKRLNEICKKWTK